MNANRSLWLTGLVVGMAAVTAVGLADTFTVGLGPGYDFNNIQDAIVAAGVADTVLVHDGVYTGTGNRDISFLGKAITVRSASGPANCVIDCQGTWEDPHRGFLFSSGEGPGAVLAGLTITNGCANVDYPLADDLGGGGIACYDTSPTITGCIIVGNYASTGIGGGGGGINSQLGSPTILDCTISNNYGYGGGGGVNSSFGSVTIRNCTIIGNHGTEAGGIGLYFNDVPPEVAGCVVQGNVGANGSGIRTYDSSPTISNCLIIDNAAPPGLVTWGGGVQCVGAGTPKIVNCTVVGNSALHGAGICCNIDTAVIVNSIVWDNDTEQIYGSASVTYSDIQGGYAGEGNIDADPAFAGASDYRLVALSPCLDAGTDAGVYTDIEGRVRPFDFPGVDNNGLLPEFDMGAYELPEPCCAALLALGGLAVIRRRHSS